MRIRRAGACKALEHPSQHSASATGAMTIVTDPTSLPGGAWLNVVFVKPRITRPATKCAAQPSPLYSRIARGNQGRVQHLARRNPRTSKSGMFISENSEATTGSTQQKQQLAELVPWELLGNIFH